MSTVVSLQMVANNVRTWREHFGIKQHVAADEIGIRREWYVQLENAQAPFKLKHLLELAHFFGIPPAEFFVEEVNLPGSKASPPDENMERIIEQKIFEAFSTFLRKEKK